MQLAPEKASASVAVKGGLEERAARFVFVNDALSVREGSLPKGVVCLPLEEALVTHSDLVEQYFMKSETRLGSEKFAALHRAHVTNGLFVHVPDGVQIDKPIEVFHLLGQHLEPDQRHVGAEDLALGARRAQVHR